MKLRNRIALTFTGLSALLIMMLGVFIYYYSYIQIKTSFFNRLYERTIVAAQHVLEADEFSKTLYDEISRRYGEHLDHELDFVIPLDEFRSVPDTLLPYFEKSFLQQIIEEEYAEHSRGHTASVGITYRDNEGIFIVIVSATDTEGQALLQKLSAGLLLAGATGLVLIFFVGRLYASQLLKPLSTMLVKIGDISSGNLQIRLPEKKGKDELALLSKNFNQMLDRLETSFDIQRNFISNASHELKNPLTAILGEIEITLEKSRHADDYRKSLEVVNLEARRLETITTSLLEIARASYSNKGISIEKIEMVSFITDVIRHVKNRVAGAQIEWIFHDVADGENGTVPLQVYGNEGLLRIAVANLIENACKFSGNDLVKIALTTHPGDHLLKLSITDRGVGVPNEDLEKIFEPFYRATNVRNFKGFGLGLSLASRIIKMHDGTLRFERVATAAFSEKSTIKQAQSMDTHTPQAETIVSILLPLAR